MSKTLIWILRDRVHDGNNVNIADVEWELGKATKRLKKERPMDMSNNDWIDSILGEFK